MVSSDFDRIGVADCGYGRKMRRRLAACGIGCTISAIAGAQGQVTIEVSRITCEQFVQYRITNDESVAIWLYGYYSGKRDNTIVDPQGFKADAAKVRQYCIMNPGVVLLQAVEEVLGPGK
jgi:acid stress chaperone HdeB